MTVNRVAALYDIHANLPALEAVLSEIERVGVERIVVGGDIFPGPLPLETFARLRELQKKIPTDFIYGNCEVAVLQACEGKDPGRMPEQSKEHMRWTAQQLSAADEHELRAWPKTVRLKIAGIAPVPAPRDPTLSPETGATRVGHPLSLAEKRAPILSRKERAIRMGQPADRDSCEVLFCHGTPRDENEIFTKLTPESAVLPAFAGVSAKVVICGHTHMQFDRVIGKFRVVNAGSVGMPFGNLGADWLLLGTDFGGDGIELRHTHYDLEAAAARIRASNYPGAEEFAAKYILNPPAEKDMLELFTKAGMK